MADNDGFEYDWSLFEYSSPDPYVYESDTESTDSEGDENNNVSRRRREKSPEETGPIFPLAQFSDEILLIIFSYLPFKDKCLLTRVNKSWKALLTDRHLWTYATVSMGIRWSVYRPYYRSQLVKIMKKRLGPSLVHLNIDIVSAACLRFLNQKCPNMLSLVLTVENPSLDVLMIPSRLTFLELRFDHSGYAPHDWWCKVTHEHFPNLKSLAIQGRSAMVYPPKHWYDNRDFDRALSVFLTQLGQFPILRHLELNLTRWECAFRGIDREDVMHGLNPLANRLESFCITDPESGWVPKDLIEYIAEEMHSLKHLKVSVCTLSNEEERIRCLELLAGLLELETLYIVPKISLANLKHVLPLLPKLKDLHVYDVDKKLAVYEWGSDERDRYRPIKQDNAVAWKNIVNELKVTCPHVNYHVIQNKNNHRMASAFC